jgi:hypothetical protein
METAIIDIPNVRWSTRSTKRIPPERLTLLTRIYAMISEIDQVKEQAKMKAIQQEISLIFNELKAVMPVMKKDVPEDAQVLRSFIFLVEKFLANGVFDKMKAWMVAIPAEILANDQHSCYHDLHGCYVGRIYYGKDQCKRCIPIDRDDRFPYFYVD